MSLDTIRLLRNILLRTFAVGFGFAVLFFLVTFTWWDTWIGLAASWFRTDEASLKPVILTFFMDIRLFMIFGVLTPALALHWTLKREQSRKT